MQVKDNFLHKVLNVAVLRAPDEHDPVVREAFHGGFLSELGAVAEFEFHLDGALGSEMLICHPWGQIMTNLFARFETLA